MGTNQRASAAAALQCCCHPPHTAATKLAKDLNFKKINFEKLRKLVNEVNWIKELRDFNVEKA